MRAARIHEDLTLRVDDIDDPTPGRGEVLVRIHAAGVCGTDLHILDGMIKPDPVSDDARPRGRRHRRGGGRWRVAARRRRRSRSTTRSSAAAASSA